MPACVTLYIGKSLIFSIVASFGNISVHKMPFLMV